jgi:hypothetical protein
MSESFIKKPCKHCPYRRDVKPFLHPERGAELARLTTNPYNEFTCHKTLDHDDEGDTYAGEESRTCAGFLTIMANECGEHRVPKGFEPSYEICYTDAFDMEQAYEEQAEIEREERNKK